MSRAIKKVTRARDSDALMQRALSSDGCRGRFDVRREGCHLMLPVITTGMNLRSRLTGIASGDQALFMTREAFETVCGFSD